MFVCRECGKQFEAVRKEAEFCSSGCRRDFHLRREQRGAQLYDLFMTYRYERPLAKALGVFTVICRMAQTWREQDRKQRAGRASWSPAKTVLERHPQYLATRN